MSTMRRTGCSSPSDGEAEKVVRVPPPAGRCQKQAKAKHVTALHVGFTGTRHGMTARQQAGVRSVLIKLAIFRRSTTVHHGDCMGADATFFRLVHELTRGEACVVCHPPTVHKWRAFLGGDDVRQELHPLARNAVIVRESDVMIAAPEVKTEQPRGGTWSTIRRAREISRPLAIVHHDGEIAWERWP
jgi:hypothetical protein